MSANNQTLIKKHKNRFLIFSNVNAESWNEINILMRDEAVAVYEKLENAIDYAKKLEESNPTEYGVQLGILVKDGAEVVIRENYRFCNHILEEVGKYERRCKFCGLIELRAKNVETNPRAIKFERLEKVLSCSKCKPHQGENRKKTVRHKTRKNHNHQEVWKKIY